MWTHTYCFTAEEMEAKMRVMKSGLTVKSMRLFRYAWYLLIFLTGTYCIFRKCKRKRLGVDIKKVDKATVTSIFERYAEMERLDKLDQLKASGHYLLNNTTHHRSPIVKPPEPIDDDVIDELLEDANNDNEVTMLPNKNTNDNGLMSSKINLLTVVKLG